MKRKVVKRTIDIVVASVLLVVLSPLLLLVVVAILVLEGRPIFYVSRRHITTDREVAIVKFRTMVRDAKSPKYDLDGRFMRDGYLDVPVDCEVYTGIGRLLEKSQLVEILQLMNVLFSGMSLIGNRPLPKDNVHRLKKYSKWQERFLSPAGMTGIAQVVGKFNLDPAQRLELEALYSRVYQEGDVLKCDVKIMYFTVVLICKGVPISFDSAVRILKGCL
jgi:lipopolysaccharide/colanic/teichoic acid biosynthesis glycosyltransferase